ncbi:MAG: FG-GAP repeat protein [Nostochopsis sp.]
MYDITLFFARYTNLPNAVNAGTAYIFHLENGVWVQKPRLEPLELKASDWFGHSVAINGEWAFVSAPLANSSPGVVDTGAVYVFRLENGVWVRKPTLQPPDLNAADYFGNTLTINGNRAVVGAKGLEGIRWDNSGGAYIFRLENGEWKPEYKFVADREPGEYTTSYNAEDVRSVALTSWGVAFLGAPLTNYRTNASTYGAKGSILQYGSVYAIGQR